MKTLSIDNKNYMSITENYDIENQKNYNEENELKKVNNLDQQSNPRLNYNYNYNNFNHSKISNLSPYTGIKSATINVTDSEFDRYKTFHSNTKTEGEKDEVNILRAKLETKKLRLRELKKQFENICEENANLKFKISDLERYKQTVSEKFENFERDGKNHDKRYAEREREFINTIQHLEEEVKNILRIK